MVNPKVYVAHSLSLREMVNDDIVPLLDKHGFTPLNPFTSRLEEFKGKTVTEIRKDLQSLHRTRMWAVQHDLRMLDEADMVLVVMDSPSIGSCMEASYGIFTRNLPTAFIVGKDYMEHTWLKALAIAIGNISNKNSINHVVLDMRKYFS